MPRFFFHVINGDFYPDNEGIECAKPEDVKANAVHIAGEMLKDQGLDLWRTQHYDMFVCDEQNKTHLRLTFHAEDLRGKLL